MPQLNTITLDRIRDIIGFEWMTFPNMSKQALLQVLNGPIPTGGVRDSSIYQIEETDTGVRIRRRSECPHCGR